MRPRFLSRLLSSTSQAEQGRPAGAGRVSRRRWLTWVTAGLATLPLIHQRLRRRRKGEPGPTGWFGHC